MKPVFSFLLVACFVGSVGLVGCGQSGSNQSTADADEALLEVASQGDLDAVNKLLGRQPPDVRDSCDWTPLMKAALNGHTPVVARLLEAGADIDAVDNGGYTAMMLAASNNHTETLTLLIERGAMIDHQEATEGLTALIWAVKQGRTEAVETLLRHQADRTLKDFSGKTAADWAGESESPALQALFKS